MVITTPTIVYRHGDAVPGERIRKILVYDDCISQPNWSVENPDNSDLLKNSIHLRGAYRRQVTPSPQKSRKSRSDMREWDGEGHNRLR
jgi:hypothetical protein